MSNPFHPYPEPKLTIELVPTGQWGDNLRDHLSRADWDSLRQACYAYADNKCEVCGGVGRKHPVECHEIWDYNDEKRIQTLTGLIALCPSCHEVKHIGLASVRGRIEQALSHLMKVNQWPGELAYAYVTRQFRIHQIRSQFEWTVNLDWLQRNDRYVKDSYSVIRQRSSKLAQATIEAITRSREARQQRIAKALTERPVE